VAEFFGGCKRCSPYGLGHGLTDDRSSNGIPSDMNIIENLERLGIVVPPAPGAVAAYEPWVRSGDLVFTSGQLPWRDGVMAYAGRLGAELTVEQGYQAARQCALNALAQLQAAAGGDLDRVRRVVRVEGYVHCAAGFRGHPQVLNGASDLFNAVFGACGAHARLAIGVSDMPLDAAVQITVTAEVDPPSR
jgi:enamine deaminase RidA (YjgF/YER057c/UK114 family)